jgi:hypothetical protein
MIEQVIPRMTEEFEIRWRNEDILCYFAGFVFIKIFGEEFYRGKKVPGDGQEALVRSQRFTREQ